MNRFWESVIGPLLDELRPQALVEVGAAEGLNTERLLAWCEAHDATLHSIDPAPGFDPEALAARAPGRLTFHREPSLAALERLPTADVVLLDGDHNWYTVLEELRLLARRARHDERPFPLVLLHDVGWPYARRDLYYEPARVPAEHRQPYARGGLVPGEPGQVEPGLNPGVCNAEREGGPRNGVLSGVEDFLGEGPAELELACLPGLSGLGLLHGPTHRERSPRLAGLVEQLASGLLTAHLEQLERERLRGLIEQERLLVAARQLARVRAELAQLEDAHARACAELTAVRGELARVYESRSWRVTEPLRNVDRVRRRLIGPD